MNSTLPLAHESLGPMHSPSADLPIAMRRLAKQLLDLKRSVDPTRDAIPSEPCAARLVGPLPERLETGARRSTASTE
jgi:hypothetical protein